jgi:4-amino-4-deoxy-L-arabinose transferase-like glycosyltransferase
MTTQLREASADAEPARAPRGWLRRLALGRPSDPVWARPALWALLILAGVLYCWDLSRNGDANTFYAAAVLSGTESWKAFFYGSLDSASFITVDKPPFAFWVMGISARIFGFNSWSLLLPQAAEGVAAVAVVYAAVRRSVGGLTGERGAHAAGLIAALALTLTPVVVAIDRDDNPDTMLTLLLAVGAWGLLESLRSDRHPLRWLMLSAVAFGLAFNTKMLEGFIPLPALAIVYLVVAGGTWRARIGRLLAAGGVLAVIALSWMTIVDLIPKTSRPYVGSSANDTVWNLAVGYNGFGRITGSAGFGGGGGTGTGGFAGRGGGGTGAGGFGGFGGTSGVGRLFGTTLGGQISWLIPFAVIALIGTLVLIGRRGRTDLARASVLVWGGWLLLEFLVLSFQQGIQHSYYTSAAAPAIAALTGIGAVALYQAYRRSGWWSLVLPLAVAVTGGWAFVLLRRTPGWNPWLAWTVLAATAATVLILALARSRRAGAVLGRRLLIPAGVAGLIAVLAGPAAYAATPLSAAISGNNPVAGPTAGGGFAGLGGRVGGGGGFSGSGGGTRADYPGGEAGSGFGRPGSGASGQGAGGQGAGGQGGAFSDGAFGDGGYRDGSPGGGGGGFRLGGGLGGAGGAVSKQLISYLEANRDGATWLVAVQGSSAAAGIILQTGGIPVMAMGGFTGSDAAPTVAQLEHYVKQGKLRYVLAGGRGGFGGGVVGGGAVGGGAVGGGGGGTVAAALSWVEQNCAAVPASAYGGSAAGAQALYRCG